MRKIGTLKEFMNAVSRNETKLCELLSLTKDQLEEVQAHPDQLTCVMRNDDLLYTLYVLKPYTSTSTGRKRSTTK